MFTNGSIPRIFSVLFNILLVLTLLIGSTAFPISVRAASIITVTTSADTESTDGFCSLREAIHNANEDLPPASPDCTAGSGADTILFADGITTIILGSTMPTITDPNGLTIDGGGDVTVSGNDLYRVFWVNASITLDNLTVAHGSCSNCAGGGIVSNGAPITVMNSTFSDNSAVLGGGIYSSGTLTITNSTFSGNNATYGGGVYNSGTLTIMNSIFSGNTAVSGGSGGGVYIYNAATATITNSTFSGNSSSGTNSVGGVYNEGSLTIMNSTFSGNSTSGAGGAGDIYQFGTSSTLNLYNSILANSGGGGDCSAEGTVAGNNNLVEDISTACGFTDGSDGNIVGSDPNLGALTGSPAYFPLNSGSVAINAGDNTTCAAADQRGVTRPQGATCDIGSYELDTTAPTVTSIVRVDPNPTSAVSVGFTVTFSEAVTGVDMVGPAFNDFVLTTTGITGASVTAVSGSGGTRTVTVSTGTVNGMGPGTIRLDVQASAITDLAGNPLASLPYTSGNAYTVIKAYKLYLPFIRR